MEVQSDIQVRILDYPVSSRSRSLDFLDKLFFRLRQAKQHQYLNCGINQRAIYLSLKCQLRLNSRILLISS